MRRVIGWWGVLAALLLVSGPLHAGAAKVGDTVWAQWKPNAWYHGKATRTCPLGLHVDFDDGDALCVHPSLVAVDAAPAEKVAPGARVLARWTNGKLYPATVTGSSSRESGAVAVRFDDGATGTAAAADLRVLTPWKPATPAKPGAVVWAQWKPNSFYHGKVGEPCDHGLAVLFDDGDRGCLARELIVVDAPPAKGAVKVGARVLATWKDDKLYPATVTAVDGASYLVRFDDGASGSVPLAGLRLW